MTGKRLIGWVLGTAIFLVLQKEAAAKPGELAPTWAHQLEVRIGEVAFTLIGQVTNTPPDVSDQYGYLPTIEGLTGLFSGTPEDEMTAYFTFYNDTRTVAVRHNGPMTIVEREGTTTVYYNEAPHASFSDPDSFRDGLAIVVMDLKQQVIIDTTTGAFSVVIGNNVTAVNPFSKDGRPWILGHRHDNFRWSLTGHLNATPPPNGHFAAYVVKAQRD